MKDYTKYNYEELVDRITELYDSATGGGGGYQGSTGQMLIELLADTTDYLHFMLERRTQESFVSTARLESSVWMAASCVGYVPRRRVSARGVLEIELQDSAGTPVPAEFDVNIPSGEVITFGSEQFIVAEDAKVKAGDTKSTIQIMEGVEKGQSFNFSAPPYSDDGYLTLPDYKSKEEFSLRVVESSGTEYTFVDEQDASGMRFGALSFVPVGYPAYDIRFSREGMRIVFGGGKFGMQPTSTINVSWIESKGTDVEIVQTGLDFKLPSNTVQDSRTTLPAMNYFYSLKNITTIDGGSDFETIEEIKQNLTAYIRSNDRAVTNNDYEFRVRKSGIGAIGDVNVYGEKENGSIIFTMNNVYAAYVKNNKLPLNATQKQDLTDYLNRYKVNTTHVVFKDAVETPLRFQIDFRRHPSLPISNQQLYAELVDRVDDYFAIKDGVIGKSFQYSEFLCYLQNLKIDFSGVTYNMTDYVYLDVDAYFPFTVPTNVYDGVIELSYEYTIKNGDVWSVIVDGTTFSVNVTGMDTVDTLVAKMQATLFSGTPYLISLENPNQIRITHPANAGTFTVSVMAGDLINYTLWKQYLQLPQAVSGGITLREPQIAAGTMLIKTDDDVPIMSDAEEHGKFKSSSSFYFPEALVDYNKAFMEIPTLPNGTYYVEYQQNAFKNFDVALDGYVSYQPFPSWNQLSDPTFDDKTVSKINLVGR